MKKKTKLNNYYKNIHIFKLKLILTLLFICHITVTAKTMDSSIHVSQTLNNIKFSPNQTQLATLETPNTLTILNYPSLTEFETLNTKKKITNYHFIPSQNAIILIHTNSISKINLSTMKKTKLLLTNSILNNVTYIQNENKIWLATYKKSNYKLHEINIKKLEIQQSTPILTSKPLTIWINEKTLYIVNQNKLTQFLTTNLSKGPIHLKLLPEKIHYSYSHEKSPSILVQTKSNKFFIIDKKTKQITNKLDIPIHNKESTKQLQAVRFHSNHNKLLISIKPFIYIWDISNTDPTPFQTLYSPKTKDEPLIIKQPENRLLAIQQQNKIGIWDLNSIDHNTILKSRINEKWKQWIKRTPFETSSEHKKRIRNTKNEFKNIILSTFKEKWSSFVTSTTIKTTSNNSYRLNNRLFKKITIHPSPPLPHAHGNIPLNNEWELLTLKTHENSPTDKNQYQLKDIKLKSPDGRYWTVSPYPPYNKNSFPSLNRINKFNKINQEPIKDNIVLASLIRSYLTGDGTSQNRHLAEKLTNKYNTPITEYYKTFFKVKRKKRRPNTKENTDFLNTVTELKELFIQNRHSELALIIGTAYENGFGVPQNYYEAEIWYLRKAKEDALGYWKLSQLYRSNKYKKDHYKAHEFALKAARDGIIDACYQVGLDLLNGYGTDKNTELGIQWIQKVANTKHVNAKIKLAHALINGIGIRSDIEIAIKFLNEAENLGSEEATLQKIKIFKDLPYQTKKQTIEKLITLKETNKKAGGALAKWILRNQKSRLLPSNINVEQLLYTAAESRLTDYYYDYANYLYKNNKQNENDQKIIKWFNKASKYTPSANYILSQIYEKGEVGNKNLKTALLYKKEAARKGHPEANYELGLFYKKYKSLPRANIKQAKALIKASKKNHSNATKELAELANVFNNSEDYQITLLEPLATQGDSKAQVQLAGIYEELPTSSLNSEFKKIYWYTKAAHNNEKDAQYKIAESDPNLATYYYQKAAENGHINSLYKISKIIKDTSQEKSLSYLISAANQGHPQAIKELIKKFKNKHNSLYNIEWALLLSINSKTDEALKLDKNHGIAALLELSTPPTFNYEIEKTIKTLANSFKNKDNTKKLEQLIEIESTYLNKRGFWYTAKEYHFSKNITHSLKENSLESLITKSHIKIQNKDYKDAIKLIRKAEKLLPKLPINIPRNKYRDLLVIQEAIIRSKTLSVENAMIFLKTKKPLRKNPSKYLVNYIKKWGGPLLQYKNKLVITLNLPKNYFK